jgi:hypothetical protein
MILDPNYLTKCSPEELIVYGLEKLKIDYEEKITELQATCQKQVECIVEQEWEIARLKIRNENMTNELVRLQEIVSVEDYDIIQQILDEKDCES